MYFTSPFCVLKLKTGETLFGEFIDKTDDYIAVKRPMNVKIFQYNDNREGFSLHAWVPFTDDEIFDIPLDIVYYVGEMKEQYIKYYGSAILKEDLAKIREEGFNRLHKGDRITDIQEDIMEQVKSLNSDYSIKYGLEPMVPTEHLDEHEEIEEEEIPSDRILH